MKRSRKKIRRERKKAIKREKKKEKEKKKERKDEKKKTTDHVRKNDRKNKHPGGISDATTSSSLIVLLFIRSFDNFLHSKTAIFVLRK